MDKKFDVNLTLQTNEVKKTLAELKTAFEMSSKEISKSFEPLKNTATHSKQLIDNMKSFKAETGEAGKEINKIVTSLNSILGNKTSFLEVLTKTENTSSQSKGGIRGALSALLKLGNHEDILFDAGGIVPGSFSQSVPVIAHGSEMILNPKQQANLFRQINGQASSANTQTPNYVYAPQIKTGATPHEVMDVLNTHSRQFFAMVADGIHTDSTLRNAVKGV